MEIRKIWAVYFSPTGGTKKTVSIVAKTIGDMLGKEVVDLDVTSWGNRRRSWKFEPDEVVVLGMPVYAGRIPNKILPDIEEMFHGSGTYLIPVSVYGNRDFGDALMELKLVLESRGFSAIAGAAAVSRHAFSDSLADGRPDEEDVRQLQEFACRVGQRILDASVPDSVTVKGNNPPGAYYVPLKEDKTPARFLKAKPATDLKKCNSCAKCAEVCPMNSMDPNDYSLVSGICIKCQACVRACPQKAKYFVDKDFLSHVKMLEKQYARRAKNFFFED